MGNGRIKIQHYNGCPFFTMGTLISEQRLVVRGGLGNNKLHAVIEKCFNEDFISWWICDREGGPICLGEVSKPFIWLQIDMESRTVYASFENQFGDDWMPLREALDNL